MLMMKIEWLIIDRSLAGKLSEAEQEQLDRWLSESPAQIGEYTSGQEVGADKGAAYVRI